MSWLHIINPWMGVVENCHFREFFPTGDAQNCHICKIHIFFKKTHVFLRKSTLFLRKSTFFLRILHKKPKCGHFSLKKNVDIKNNENYGKLDQ